MPQLLQSQLFSTWQSMLDVDLQKEFAEVEQVKLNPNSFTFYTSVSVMASSKIEGEAMEIDSYVKHKMFNVEYLPELTEKPNDLYRAYLFAQDNLLNPQNLFAAHQLLTEHLLPQPLRGCLRKTEMLVLEHKTGRIQYEAAPLHLLPQAYDQLWQDVKHLLQQDLSLEQTFYYAAYLHLVFVNLHPFSDGNGRLARLLEKWFLAEKLGENAWYIPSERYYYQEINAYYKNLARLGWHYEGLDYQKALPFLLMLPQSVLSS